MGNTANKSKADKKAIDLYEYMRDVLSLLKVKNIEIKKIPNMYTFQLFFTNQNKKKEYSNIIGISLSLCKIMDWGLDTKCIESALLGNKEIDNYISDEYRDVYTYRFIYTEPFESYDSFELVRYILKTIRYVNRKNNYELSKINSLYSGHAIQKILQKYTGNKILNFKKIIKMIHNSLNIYNIEIVDNEDNDFDIIFINSCIKIKGIKVSLMNKYTSPFISISLLTTSLVYNDDIGYNDVVISEGYNATLKEVLRIHNIVYPDEQIFLNEENKAISQKLIKLNLLSKSKLKKMDYRKTYNINPYCINNMICSICDMYGKKFRNNELRYYYSIRYLQYETMIYLFMVLNKLNIDNFTANYIIKTYMFEYIIPKKNSKDFKIWNYCESCSYELQNNETYIPLHRRFGNIDFTSISI